MIHSRSCRGNEGTRCNWHQVLYLGELKRFSTGGLGISLHRYLFISFCKVCFALELSFSISSPKYQSFRECAVWLCTDRKCYETSALERDSSRQILCVGALLKHAHPELGAAVKRSQPLLIFTFKFRKKCM